MSAAGHDTFERCSRGTAATTRMPRGTRPWSRGGPVWVLAHPVRRSWLDPGPSGFPVRRRNAGGSSGKWSTNRSSSGRRRQPPTSPRRWRQALAHGRRRGPAGAPCRPAGQIDTSRGNGSKPTLACTSVPGVTGTHGWDENHGRSFGERRDHSQAVRTDEAAPWCEELLHARRPVAKQVHSGTRKPQGIQPAW